MLTDRRRLVVGIVVVALLGLLSVAAIGGRHELEQCETALREALGPTAPYFRTGYRMRQEWDGDRVFYLVFFRPMHGVAGCRFERHDGRYRLASFTLEMTLPGGPPAPVP